MVAEERILRRYLPTLFIIAFLSVMGCATTDDLRRVHSDLNRQIQVTNEKIASVEQGWAPLREEIAGLRNEIAKTHEAIQSLRGSQAEGRAEMTDIREQLQQIRGTADGLRKELSSASAKTGKREEEEKVLREKLDNLTFKINFTENFLGIGKNEEPATAPAAPTKEPATAPAAPTKEPAGKGRTDKESLYTAAYELFKEAKYEKSRRPLKTSSSSTPTPNFPTTPSSGSASATISRRNTKRPSSSTKR